MITIRLIVVYENGLFKYNNLGIVRDEHLRACFQYNPQLPSSS